MAQAFEASPERTVLPQPDRNMSAFFQLLASNISPPPHSPSTSQPLASTSTATAIISPQHGASPTIPQIRDSQQARVATLASYGIKVRDFAYESTLPPIAPVRFLPRQIQPRPWPLKRARRNDEGDDLFSPATDRHMVQKESSSKRARLERQITEPNLQPPCVPPSRTRGYANLEDYEPFDNSQLTTVNSQQSERSSPSQSQYPLQYVESQGSEPYIDTPHVTPNGSLQWPATDNSPIPASQLNTASQITVPELISKLNFSQVDEPSERTSSISSIPSDPPSSTAPLSGNLSCSPSPQPHRHQPLQRSRESAPLDLLNLSPRLHAPSISPAPARRYYLRKRPDITSPPSSPTKPTTRAHRNVHTPTPRPLAYSNQSPHSRVKTRNVNGSPSSRVLRKNTVGVVGGKKP